MNAYQYNNDCMTEKQAHWWFDSSIKVNMFQETMFDNWMKFD